MKQLGPLVKVMALPGQRLPEDIPQVLVIRRRLNTSGLNGTVLCPGDDIQFIARSLFDVDAQVLLGHVQTESAFEEHLLVLLRELSVKFVESLGFLQGLFGYPGTVLGLDLERIIGDKRGFDDRLI